jgi:hypothetical protein
MVSCREEGKERSMSLRSDLSLKSSGAHPGEPARSTSGVHSGEPERSAARSGRAAGGEQGRARPEEEEEEEEKTSDGDAQQHRSAAREDGQRAATLERAAKRGRTLHLHAISARRRSLPTG